MWQIAIMLVLLALVGAYAGAFADRFCFWFHVSRARLWRRQCSNCFESQTALTHVPLIGYVIQRGVCISCKARLPIRSATAELIGATVLPIMWFVGGASIPSIIADIVSLLATVMIVMCLIGLALSDLFYDEIPAALAYTAVASTLIIGLLNGYNAFMWTVIAGVLGGAIMLLLLVASKWQWVHGHDVILGVIMGLVAGWPAVFVTFAFAYLLAISAGLFEWGWHKKLPVGASSFGPFLIFGFALQLLLACVARIAAGAI